MLNIREDASFSTSSWRCPFFIPISQCFLNFLLDLPLSTLDVAAVQRDEELIQSGENSVVKIVSERELRQQGELGLALKMGRNFRIINRIGAGQPTFYDRKERFARRIGKSFLFDPGQALLPVIFP